MQDDHRAPHTPQDAGDGAPSDHRALPFDEALGRFEDVLLSYPYDRALPDLPTILREARITEEFLRSDDRALKVLHEAILARPLASHDAVARAKTEVELLTVEVQVLTEQLRDPQVTAEETERVTTRLARVRRRLDELRERL